MIKRCSWWSAIAVVGMPLLIGTALGQDVLDRDSWVGGDDLWTNDDAWEDSGGAPSGAPSPVGEDRWALVQDGNVTVDSDVGTSGLTIQGGVVQINDGASLTVDLINDPFSVGQTENGANGTLRLLGNGKFTGLKANNRGLIEFGSSAASLETSGDFSTSGVLQLNVTASGTSIIKVGGAATIGGLISPVFDGVTPAFGDSFQFVSGANSVVLADPVVELPESVVLGRGLGAFMATSNGNASLTIDNAPILQVDRVGGTTKILNVVGDDIEMTGFTIGSKRGLLNNDGFTPSGAAGFDAPNPLTTMISEISLENKLTLAVDGEVDLGKAYGGGATHPNDEDVTFEFSTPDARILQGQIEYLGPANDLVANVNPETGEISLYHLSTHLDPIDVVGYDVLSASGSLDVAAWSKFGEGWSEANPQATSISELSLESSQLFANGTVISLGNIFKTDGSRDIVVEYATSDSVFSATVEYGEVPGPVVPDTIPGDIDGDGEVGFNDFLTLSANFGNAIDPLGCCGDIDEDGMVGFADFLILSGNFGKSVGAVSIPEPSSSLLLGLGGFLLLGRRRRVR